MPRAAVPLLERFERCLPDQLHDSECWEWQGCKDRADYGRIAAGGKGGRSFRAHRVAWEAHHAQPIPPGMCICHACDNPACVNPAHLFLGTSAENTADKVAKGRARGQPPGEAHSRARLSEAQVLEIRRLYATSGISYRRLADIFRVGHNTIARAVASKAWRHLD